MIEIFVLISLCKKMGELLRDKGWTKPIWMQVLVVTAWFTGMIIGVIAYAMIIGFLSGAEAVENLGWKAVVFAYVSAGISECILFLVASNFPEERKRNLELSEIQQA